jgi:hypothetical protein
MSETFPFMHERVKGVTFGQPFSLEVDIPDDTDINFVVAWFEGGLKPPNGRADRDSFVALEIKLPHGGGFVTVHVPTIHRHLSQQPARGVVFGYTAYASHPFETSSAFVYVDLWLRAFKGISEQIGPTKKERLAFKKVDELCEVNVAPNWDINVQGRLKNGMFFDHGKRS